MCFVVIIGDKEDSDVHLAANKPVLLVYLAPSLLAEERNRKIEAHFPSYWFAGHRSIYFVRVLKFYCG